MRLVSAMIRSATAALILLTGACALGPVETSAPKTFFLNPEIVWNNPRGRGEQSAAVLLVPQPKPQPGFDTARMVYLMRPYEVHYYGYNQWADTPAHMLQRIMVENLEKSGQWHAVLQAPGAVPAHYRLDSDNLVLEQQFFSSPSRVRLALRAQVVETKTQSILATRSFELFEPAPSDDPYGGVIAANRAAAKLIIEMAEWINKVLRGRK
jgi:cholesterol transport system auxiliary component